MGNSSELSSNPALVIHAKNNHHADLSIHDTIIDSRHIHYAISGPDSLPTLVFIHGSPGSWTNYRKFMWDTLLRKKFRMVSIDRPGFGYSLGGPAVVELAANAPDLASHLIIMGGSIDVAQEKNARWRTIMNTPPLHWLLPGAFGPSNTEILYLKQDLVPLQKQFEKINCDVHFIHGDLDDWVPIQNIAYGKRMLINARSISIDTVHGGGHLIPWNDPTTMRDLLLKIADSNP